jgi:hypothetical protein
VLAQRPSASDRSRMRNGFVLTKRTQARAPSIMVWPKSVSDPTFLISRVPNQRAPWNRDFNFRSHIIAQSLPETKVENILPLSQVISTVGKPTGTSLPRTSDLLPVQTSRTFNKNQKHHSNLVEHEFNSMAQLNCESTESCRDILYA